MMNTLMVTGTGAGVGTTTVSCVVVRAAMRRGWRTAAFVPCATGFAAPEPSPAAIAQPLYARDARGAYDPPEIAQPIDVERDPGQWPPAVHALASTARCLFRGRDAIVPYVFAEEGAPAVAARRSGRCLFRGRDAIVPYVFAEEGAPAVAARRSGARILLHVLETRLRRLAGAYECVVVDGSGGLAVPVTRAHDLGALAAQWAVPVLVVARPGRDALNAAALTVQAAQARGVTLLGFAIDAAGATDDDVRRSIEDIARTTRLPVFGAVPALRGLDIAGGALDALAAADGSLDEDALFARWEAVSAANDA